MAEEEGEEPEVEVAGGEGTPLDVSRVPVIVTVSQVGSQSVVDLSSEEEPCAAAALRIAVSAQGRIVGISKAGGGGVDPTLTQEMVEVAQKLGPGLIQRLDQHVAAVNTAAAAAAAAGS